MGHVCVVVAVGEVGDAAPVSHEAELLNLVDTGRVDNIGSAVSYDM